MAKSEGNPRLPVTHPDYVYVESKNPYWAKLRNLRGDGAFLDNETEAHAGRWRTLFRDSGTDKTNGRRPLHVEICCNGGHVTLGWAARDPSGAYVGIDWKFKQIYYAWEKARKRGIHNTIFLRARGERIDRIFAPGEVDHLALYFPDPWPKKSHHKHRFITPEFLARAAQVVRKGGTFHIKTDHRGYFEWIRGAVAESAGYWLVTEETTDLHATHPDPASLQIPDVTLFERLFIKDGLPINSIRLERK